MLSSSSLSVSSAPDSLAVDPLAAAAAERLGEWWPSLRSVALPAH